MITKLHHALTHADYYAESSNCVRVVEGDKEGRFDRNGVWLEGELKNSDPQMCRWLSGGVFMQELATKSTEERN